MSKTNAQILTDAIRRHYSAKPDKKTQKYIGQFFDRSRTGTKIMGKVEGNHGTYTVSIEVDGQRVTSACSCYIGKHGCHHCVALAATYLHAPQTFTVLEIVETAPDRINTLAELQTYLAQKTLDELTTELKAHGITQKALAESMGMSPRHFTVVKSSERRNRYFNELGAMKMACMWALEHLSES